VHVASYYTRDVKHFAVDRVDVVLPDQASVTLDCLNPTRDDVQGISLPGWTAPTVATGYLPPVLVRTTGLRSGKQTVGIAEPDYRYWRDSKNDYIYELIAGIAAAELRRCRSTAGRTRGRSASFAGV
jgi:hypothetical protein